ncbi:hypothetical protein KGF57_003308 [Candida theae]|uniref:Uncharacterized protein n=1 Tax=Candida theae TaxID=1198502 RepID=A0AAD5BDM1_9ASCO|nr:uncharacterized protein KGF57_003308 [Candida theae]KAI5957614.1 hypothetical protein KGF57_003308 [Candida theae]
MATYQAAKLSSPLPSTPPRGRPVKTTSPSVTNSSSPSKERKSQSIGAMGHSPKLGEDDLRSIISSPQLTPDQLRSISRSPLARRMHVVSSNPSNDKYVIPIPLTLRLPPRLTSPTRQRDSTRLTPASPLSDSSLPKQKRSTLVYTSHGYEKIDVSSSSEDEQEENLPPTVPEKPSLAKKPQPPSVATNKTKYSKIAYPNKEPDELSMIEEMSNFGSRNSSITRSTNKGMKHEHSKKLPNLPAKIDETEAVNITDGSTSGKPFADSLNLVGMKKPQGSPSNKGLKAICTTNRAVTQGEVPQAYSTRPPHSRCFSETSQVSSVSSFSSAGAFGLANSRQKFSSTDRSVASKNNGQFSPHRLQQVDTSYKLPPAITDRQVSDASQASTSSSNSWNSLQQSIDISLTKEQDDKEDLSMSRVEASGKASEENLWSDASSTSSEESVDEISPLNITRQNTQSTLQSKKSFMDEQLHSKPDASIDHRGAGVAFEFPNNSSNITNSKSLKSKSIDEDGKSTKSRFSFYSNGQIEIPDLACGKVMDQYSSKSPSSYNETVFSDRPTETSVSDVEHDEHEIRKIRVPSRDALLHFQQQYQNYTEDGDSDNEGSLRQSTLYSTPAIAKTAPDLQSNVPLSRAIPTSPVRHRRGKSMYNIDFNTSESSPKAQHQLHQKSKSTDFNSRTSFAESSHSKASTSASHTSAPLRNNSNKEPPNAVPEKLDIQVAEPPKAVHYAVDFRVNNSNDCDFGNKYTTPKALDTRHSLRAKHQSTKRKPPSESSSQRDDSDAESVVIDLTDDKYRVVTIQRSDSTLSYRSVMEKRKGKEVEVILLDDEEETREKPERAQMHEADETDDELSSIYSKYKNDSWLFGPKSKTGSTASFDATSQNSNLNVVQRHREPPEKLQNLRSLTTAGRIVHELNLKRSNTSASSKASSSHKDGNRKVEANTRLKNQNNRVSTSYIDDKYFDYAMNGNYNFQTFMNERVN